MDNNYYIEFNVERVGRKNTNYIYIPKLKWYYEYKSHFVK